MPKGFKQTPTTAQSTNNGSFLGLARSVATMERAPLKILMYGGNRVGKTHLACTFTKPLLLVSLELAPNGGAETVRKMPGVDQLQFPIHLKSSADIKALGNEIIANAGKYKTVVVDSVTAGQELILAEILNLPAVPDQMSFGMVNPDQYRQRSEKTRAIFRPFIDAKVDTIFLAKEKDHNPPKEEKVTASGKVAPDMRPSFVRGLHTGSYIAAEIGGATVGWLQDACDCVCRLYIEEEMKETLTVVNKREIREWRPTGKFTRYLRTGYHPNFAAGLRSCDPDSVPEFIMDPTAQKIMELIRGK